MPFYLKEGRVFHCRSFQVVRLLAAASASPRVTDTE